MFETLVTIFFFMFVIILGATAAASLEDSSKEVGTQTKQAQQGVSSLCPC